VFGSFWGNEMAGRFRCLFVLKTIKLEFDVFQHNAGRSPTVHSCFRSVFFSEPTIALEVESDLKFLTHWSQLWRYVNICLVASLASLLPLGILCCWKVPGTLYFWKTADLPYNSFDQKDSFFAGPGKEDIMQMSQKVQQALLEIKESAVSLELKHCV
jgi:hypothetical protein